MKIIEHILAWLSRLLTPKSDERTDEIGGRPYVSDDGITLLKYYEGLSLSAYRDIVGKWTIGYGDTENVSAGLVITDQEAEQRLRTRLERDFIPGVISSLDRAPRQCEFDAMVSLAYNIGVSAFKRSTLLKKYNAGDIQGAADQFLVWHYAAKRSIKGLRKRRATERALFLGADAQAAIKAGDEAS